MTNPSVLEVHPRCLTIWVDETGHEEFADPNHPVFGYAGCLVMAGSAKTVLVEPWRAMKTTHFGGADVPLHASELDPTPEQTEALGRFFKSQPFGRFGVTMTGKTELLETHSAMALMPHILARRWTDLATRLKLQPIEAAIIFEASHRLDPLVEKHFAEIVITVDGHKIPVHHCFINKQQAVEELEVADFIAQAAGGQAARQFRGESGFRKDYQAVFPRDEWVSFMAVTAAAIAPRDGQRPMDVRDAPRKTSHTTD